MADNLDKIVGVLSDVSEAVKGFGEQINKQGEEIAALKSQKTSSEPAPAKTNDALSEAVNKQIKDMQDEIAKFKTMKIVTPESAQKSMEGEKLKFYRALFKAHLTKDMDAIKELREYQDKMKYTYNYNETAGAGSGQMGYSIPTEISQNIVDAGVLYQGNNSITPYLNAIPMNTNALDVPEYINGVQAGYVAAASQLTDSAGSASRYQLTAKKIAALLFWDNEALQDVSTKLINHIEQRAMNAFDYRTNYIVLNGSGSANFANCGVTGILSASGTNTVTMASSAIGTLDADDLSDLMEAVTAPINNGVFVISRTFRSFIRTMKDSYGQYILSSPAGNGAIETIWGRPVIWITTDSNDTAIMPARTSVGSATAFAIYGDFGLGVLFGDRMTLEVDLDTSLRFDYYQTAIRYVKRQDYKVIGKYFAVLKTA